MLPSSINSIFVAEIIFQNVIGLCFDFTTFDIRWCLLFWSQQKPSCLSLYCCFRTFYLNVCACVCVFLFVSEIEVDSILNYAIHASLGEYWGDSAVNHVLCWCIFIVCIVALCLMASNVIAMTWCDYTRHRRAVNDAHNSLSYEIRMYCWNKNSPIRLGSSIMNKGWVDVALFTNIPEYFSSLKQELPFRINHTPFHGV